MGSVNDERLYASLTTLEEFFVNAATLLKAAQEILTQEYGYEKARDSRTAYAWSQSIERPRSWLPKYLCLFLRKKDDGDDFVALLVMLSGLDSSSPVFPLYGFRLRGVRSPKRVDSHVRAAVTSVAQGVLHHDHGDYVEVEYKDRSVVRCLMIREQLWSITDLASLRRVIDRLASLPIEVWTETTDDVRAPSSRR